MELIGFNMTATYPNGYQEKAELRINQFENNPAAGPGYSPMVAMMDAVVRYITGYEGVGAAVSSQQVLR